MELSEIIERSIERIFYRYWSRVYRDRYRYRFIAQPYYKMSIKLTEQWENLNTESEVKLLSSQ